jgi:OCT family organic cation transporter-like MFS transporter 4/5
MLQAYYVEWGPGVVFGICCLVVSFLCFFLPETRNRPLPQTLAEIENWDSTKKNST